MYHGTHISSLNIVDGMDLCLTYEQAIAEAYAEAVSHLGETHVHTVSVARTAKLATEGDVREFTGDSSSYIFELVDDKGVRAQLAAAGFDGVEYEDLSPDNNDTHTTVRIWAASAITEAQ